MSTMYNEQYVFDSLSACQETANHLVLSPGSQVGCVDQNRIVVFSWPVK